MAQETQRSARRKKIEPLDYTIAAQAPALKGMTSFLDVSAETVRASNVLSMARIAQVKESQDFRFSNEQMKHSDGLSLGGVVTPGDKTPPGHGNEGLNPAQSPSEPLQSQVIESGYAVQDSAPLSSAPPDPPVIKEEVPDVSLSLGDLKALGFIWYPGGVSTPGGETHSRVDVVLRPGVGRSKIRKCVLAQDGHSLGEEAIYQILWRSGKQEGSDPNGSRVLSIGAADIGMRANMAKKNVRQNISRLYEKLAIEILEDFQTVSSKPRKYRVYSYKQILERRRAAGLEYVMRNKGVLFCTPDGVEIKSSPGGVSSPGVDALPRPALSKRQRYLQQPAERKNEYGSGLKRPTTGEILPEEVRVVSEALNRYWPVDEEAAVQLIRNCRTQQADAHVDEIVFFVREKQELIRSNHSITNPTGLILATVPKSFVGASFASFRDRSQNQARIAAEEKQRKQREEEQLKEWLREQVRICEATVNDMTISQQERDVAEQRLRGFSRWNM